MGTIAAIAFSVLIFGLIAVGAGFVIRDSIRRRGNWGWNFKQAICTQCGTPMPMMFRKPTSWRQAMWGGWTCAECGFELDKWGRPIEGQDAPAKWNVLRAVEEVEKKGQRPPPRDERIREMNDQTQRGDAP
ncbi:MAG TPA: hypothetical protein VMG10_16400 [Gemmataceae bacterium]|nr:hypothetical protein [Gemmataceae bacterium]